MKNTKLNDLKSILEKYEIREDYEVILEGLKKDLKDKRYGLVWEEHIEDVEETLKDKTPILKETDKTIKNSIDGKHNLIIEGDNYYALNILRRAGIKVSSIYIDPPYNTLKEKGFRYNDKMVDENDSWRHSKWLSFMNKRLRLAKKLLEDDGAIFISIDDNEVAQLKMLCDDIFGEKNFIINMPRQTKKSGKTTSSFSKNHDYVLVYTNKSRDVFIMEDFISDSYDQEDEFVKERGKFRLNQTLDYDSLVYSRGLDYPLDYKGKTFYPGGDYENHLSRQKGNHNRADWAWRWSRGLFDFGEKNGFVVLNENTGRIYTKTYANAIIKERINTETNSKEYFIEYVQKTKPHSSLEFTNNVYSNDRAKKDLAKYGLENSFDYSKPVELIKTLIKSHHNKDGIILDFFAGSGTTGQAVLELNEEDGGSRQFILATNNEVQEDIELEFLQEKNYMKRPSSTNKRTIAYREWYQDYLLFKESKEFSEIEESEDYQELGICRGVTYKRVSESIRDNNANLTYYKVDLMDNDQDYYDIEDQLLMFSLELIKMRNSAYNIEGDIELGLLWNDNLNIIVSTEAFITSKTIDFLKEKMSKDKLTILYVLDENKNDERLIALNLDNILSIPDRFINWLKK